MSIKKSIKFSFIFLLLFTLCLLGLMSMGNLDILLKPEKSALAYETGGKACSTWDEVRTELSAGRSCYLANDIILGYQAITTIRKGTRTNVAFNNATFYGNGKNIKIAPGGYENLMGNREQNVDWGTTNSTSTHGILANTINNCKIKDLNINLTVPFTMGNWVDSGDNYFQYLGIVAGSIENSTFTNVNVKVDTGASFVFYGKRNGGSGGQGAALGAFAGNVKSGTFNNCSVTLNGGIWSTAEDGSENNNASTAFNGVRPRAVVGGFFGEFTGSGDLNMNNVALYGSTDGLLGTSLWGGNNGDGNFRMGLAGGIIGGVSGSKPVSIDGLIYEYGGSFAALRDLTTRTGLIIGNRYQASALSIKNIYRSRNAQNGTFIKLNSNSVAVYRSTSGIGGNGAKYTASFGTLARAPYSGTEQTDNSYNNRICGRNSSTLNPSGSPFILENYNYYSNNGYLDSANSATYGTVSVTLNDDISKINIKHTISDTNKYAISGVDYGSGKDNALLDGRVAKGSSSYTAVVEKNKITKIECFVAEIGEVRPQADVVKTYNGSIETYRMDFSLTVNLLSKYMLGVKDSASNLTFAPVGSSQVDILKDVDIYKVAIYDENKAPLSSGTLIGANKTELPSKVCYYKGGDVAKYTVNKSKLEIEANTFYKDYGQSDPELSQTFSVISGDKIIAMFERAVGENAGSYNITSLKHDSKNYDVSLSLNGGNNRFIIRPKELKVVPNKFEITYGELSEVLEQTIDGVNGEKLDISFTRNEGINVKLYDLKTIVNNNKNYSLSFESGTNLNKFEIKPRLINVSPTKSYIKIYGSAEPRFSETISTGYYSDSLTLSFKREIGEDVGYYKFDAIENNNNTNYVLNFVGNDNGLQVDKYTLTITPTVKETIFGNQDLQLSETISGVLGDQVAVIYHRDDAKNKNGFTNAGKYNITKVDADRTDGNYEKNINNYTLVLDEEGRKGKYIVNALSIAVGSVNSFEKIYGESDPIFRQLTEGLQESFYIKLVRDSGENVGTYDFVSAISEDANYLPFIDGITGKDKFLINKYAITVTANQFSSIYGENFPLFEQNIIGINENIKITYTISDVARNADVYSLISFVNPNDNYDISVLEMENKFTIYKRTLTITAKDFGKIYGENDPIFEETFIGGYGDSIRIEYLRDNGETVGTYNFNKINHNDNNHIINFVENGGSGKFVISKFDLKIAPKSFSKIYGEVDPKMDEYFEVVHLNGITNNIFVEYSRTNANLNDVGNYDLLISNFDNDNYIVAFESGTNTNKFTINKLVLEYNPTVYSAQFSSENSKKTAYVETIEGLDSYRITINLVREQGESVDSYDIISIVINERNYELSYNADDLLDKFIITPYSIKIKAKDFSKIFGDADPIFEETFYANGESITATFIRQLGENAGKYDFVEAISDNANYVFSFINLGNVEKFTIIAKSVSVLWAEDDFTYSEKDQSANVWAKYIDISGTEIMLNTATTGEFKDFSENGYVFEASFKNQEINYILDQNIVKTFFIKKIHIVINSPVYNGSQLQYLDELPTVTHPIFNKYGDYTLLQNQKLIVNNTEYSWTFSPTAIALNNHTFENLSGTMTLYIAKATPKYTAPAGLSATYNDTLAEVQLTEGFEWQFSIDTLVGNAGFQTHKIIFTPLDTDNYIIVRDINVFIKVERAIYDMANISLESKSFNFDNKPKNLLINGELPFGVSVSYNGNNVINAGEYTVTAIFEGDYDNYVEIANMSGNLIIEKIEYDFSGLSLPRAEKIYNGLPQGLDLIGDLPIGLDGIEVKVKLIGSRADVGVVSTVATFSSESLNYKPITFTLSNSLTIVRRELKLLELETYYTSYIATDTINLIEGEHFTVDNLANNEKVSYTYKFGFESKQPGETYLLIDIVSLDSSNYYFGKTQYKINAHIDATVDITVSNNKYSYDNRMKECDVSATVGKVSTTEFKVEYFDKLNNKIGAPKKAGEYKVKVSMQINGLTDIFVEDVLVIDKIMPEYSIIGSSVIQYGGYYPQYMEIKGRYNDGFNQIIDAEYSFEGEYPEVGTYNTKIAFEGSDNYLPLESDIISLVIIKREIVLEYYGGVVYEYDGHKYGIEFVIHNLIGNEKDIVKVAFGNEDKVVNAGEYVAEIKEVNENYNVIKEMGFKTITITKARLEVEILTNDEMVEGDKFRYSLKYTGFKGDDGIGDISIYPEVKDNFKVAGSHIVIAEGGESLNYNFNYVKFNLLVYHNNLKNMMGNSEIIIEGVYHPDSQIEISSANMDKVKFGGIMGIGNKVTSAYTISVEENNNNKKSYDAIINNVNLRSKYFSSAYAVDSKGNVIKINNLITDNTLRMSLEDDITIVFVDNYTLVYAIIALVIVLAVILLLVVINNHKFNSCARVRNSWTR